MVARSLTYYRRAVTVGERERIRRQHSQYVKANVTRPETRDHDSDKHVAKYSVINCTNTRRGSSISFSFSVSLSPPFALNYSTRVVFYRFSPWSKCSSSPSRACLLLHRLDARQSPAI